MQLESEANELEKGLWNYVDDKRQYGCAVTSEMCQLKTPALTKQLGITGFKATLCLCQVEGADLSSSREWRGVATANMHSTHTPHWPLLA